MVLKGRTWPRCTMTNVIAVHLCIICCLFCGTAPSMEGKYTQQYTSTSGWSRRHGTNSEGYPGGLREVYSVYCCCSGIQWRGRQSKVRYDNCQDWGRRYVLHTVCIADLTQFTSTVQTFAVLCDGVSYGFPWLFKIHFSFFIIVVKYYFRLSTIWRQSLKSQKFI